jgi:hypothetical protein
MEDEGIICDICCNSYASSTIGAAVPCGHMFHMKCFEKWIADQDGPRKQSPIYCPSCDEICSRDKPFIRLYLTIDDNHDCHCDHEGDTGNEFMDKTNESKRQGSEQLLQDEKSTISSLQSFIRQLNGERFELMDKVQQHEAQMIESTSRLHDLTLELASVRKDLKIVGFELKTINHALDRSNEKLQKSHAISKSDLDRRNKSIEMLQNQTKANHRAIAKASQQFDELSQRIETLTVGSNVKQGMHVRKRSGKGK